MQANVMQVNVKCDKIGFPVLVVDQILMKIDAVEIGNVPKLGPDIGAKIVDGIAGDPRLESGRHDARGHAADELFQ